MDLCELVNLIVVAAISLTSCVQLRYFPPLSLSRQAQCRDVNGALDQNDCARKSIQRR
jgi:hypothetical protein